MSDKCPKCGHLWDDEDHHVYLDGYQRTDKCWQAETADLRRQLAERDKTIEELRAAITTPEICAGVVRREVETRLAAANATIDKLPKYADTGGAIVPGMLVCFWATRRASENWRVRYVFGDAMSIEKSKTVRYLHQTDAYSSTKAAAEAARSKP